MFTLRSPNHYDSVKCSSPITAVAQLLPAGLPTGQHAGISFTQCSKMDFSPQKGRYVAAINVNLTRAIFDILSVQKMSYYDPRNCQNLELCKQASKHLYLPYCTFIVHKFSPRANRLHYF